MSFVNVQERKLPFVFRYLADLVAYRHLCWNLVGIDLRSRFRRTRLGLLWALIQPLALALMIAYVWNALDRSVSLWEFALYVLAGQAVFELFTNIMMSGQDTLIASGGYLRQARVPFFIFQMRVVLTALVFFLIEVVAVLGFAAAVGAFPAPGPHLLLIPVYVVVVGLFGAAFCIIFSIAGTLYRDVRHASGLLTRALFLTSPVLLPRAVLDQPQLRFLEFLNPLVPLLDMFRDPVLYGQMWQMQDALVIAIWTVGLWVLALVWGASVGRKLVFAI